jgi:4-amino-4-deoxy-L-arabinose transferase-like glycosyltransferase
MNSTLSTSWQSKLCDIKFWIVLFFIVRLYGITNPPLESASVWRQCDVLMIARNFYEVSANILYPRIDVGGNVHGTITGSEFPVYNYLIFLLSKIFGFSNWYGRLINLIISSAAVFYLHKILSRYFNKEAAFHSSMLLLVSGWFSFSRITIPDVFAASACIIALYFSFRFLETGKKTDLLIFTLLALAGCLSKISASSLLTVLLLPILSKDHPLNRKILLSCAAVVILTTVLAWYFIWVPHLNTIGSYYFFMGLPITEGLQDIIQEPGKFAKRLFDDPLKYTGSALLISSIYLSFKHKKFLALFAFLIPMVAFSVFVLKSGRWFYINGYYFLMLVPSIVLLCGFGLSLIKNKTWQIVILLIVAMENIGNQVHVFEIKKPYIPYVGLEKVFDELGASRKELIAVGCDNCSSAAIYMSHRKGWILQAEQLDTPHIRTLQKAGLKYILIQKKLHGINVDLPYQEIYNSEDFKIYKL